MCRFGLSLQSLPARQSKRYRLIVQKTIASVYDIDISSFKNVQDHELLIANAICPFFRVFAENPYSRDSIIAQNN
jgi:hypothetical protein